MRKLTIFVGLPGSGKSTEAYRLGSIDEEIAVIERDWIRKGLHGRRLGTRDQEDMVTTIQQASVKALLREDRHVIVADTNLRWTTIYQWQRIARSLKADLEIISLMDVPPQTCIQRDAQRDKSVGEDDPSGYKAKTIIYGLWEKFVISSLNLWVADMTSRVGGTNVLKAMERPTWLETPEGQETYNALLDIWHREFVRVCEGDGVTNFV